MRVRSYALDVKRLTRKNAAEECVVIGEFRDSPRSSHWARIFARLFAVATPTYRRRALRGKPSRAGISPYFQSHRAYVHTSESKRTCECPGGSILSVTRPAVVADAARVRETIP
jgi:hypothetical protein